VGARIAVGVGFWEVGKGRDTRAHPLERRAEGGGTGPAN
jgi:hypothetical protein